MPIYEYQCDRCGHEFEEIQRITAPPLDTCPACGRRSVQRLISHSSFILKGSGWYVTDYARKGSGGGSPSDEPQPSDKSKTRDVSMSASETSAGGANGSKRAPAPAPAG